MMVTAKVFWTGKFQAVRFPEGFHMDSSEVTITKNGAQIILEPVANEWSWLSELRGAFDDDAAEAALKGPEEQQRPSLEQVFHP